MKSRALSLLLCFVMILSLLAGCENIDGGSESSGGSSVSEIQEETHPPEGDPIEEELDFFTENGHDLLPEAGDVPENYIATETENLYKLDLPLPKTDGMGVYAANNILLAFYWDGEEQFCDMISLESCQLIKRVSFGYDTQWGQFDDGGFWLVDCQTLQVRLYDAKGNETIAQEGNASEDFQYPDEVYVTSDKKYLISTYPDDGSVQICNLATGEITKPEIPPYMSLWEIAETSKGIYFQGNEGLGLLYDLQTGETKEYSNDNETGYFFGDIYQCSVDGYLKLGALDSDKYVYAPFSSNGYLQDLAYGCAVVYESMENSLSFWNLRRGVSETIVRSEDIYGLCASFLENGRALMLEFSDEGPQAYVYDLPAAMKTAQTEAEILCVTDEEFNNEIKSVAERVYNHHGVEIIYGSEGNDFDIYDYVGVAVLDLYEIYKAINTTEEILGQFPKGMLREAYSETDKGLQIYLCGSIYGVQSGGVGMAGGVTTEINGYIAVVLDIYDNLWYNIFHEFSHVFDNRIAKMSDPEETDWLALWESATPVPDAYTYSYDDYYDNYKYTISDGYDDPENVWFTDGYGRTFPTEDRARLFEYMLTPEDDAGYLDIYSYENLVYKAKLYSYILRQCFPSCNTEGANSWERNLGVIDSSVLPETESVG